CTRPGRWREWDGHLKTTRRPKECAFMRQRLLAGLSLVCGVAACGAAEFAPPVRLQADGVAIRGGAPGYAWPCWADMDGKGNGDGTFRKAEVLKGTDGQPLIIPTKGENEITETICTRPFAVDWDGDGILDLVVGNFSGTFYWFRGEGKGRFSPKPELIMAGDE